MTDPSNPKARLKILIAVAWIDGEIQPEEQKYLLKVAEEQGLLEDSELKPLLHGLRSLSLQDCYTWIEDYLGPHPTEEAANELIETISSLIYSDGDMASEEANLVSRLINFSAGNTKPVPLQESMLNAMKHLYQRWRKKLEV